MEDYESLWANGAGRQKPVGCPSMFRPADPIKSRRLSACTTPKKRGSGQAKKGCPLSTLMFNRNPKERNRGTPLWLMFYALKRRNIQETTGHPEIWVVFLKQRAIAATCQSKNSLHTYVLYTYICIYTLNRTVHRPKIHHQNPHPTTRTSCTQNFGKNYPKSKHTHPRPGVWAEHAQPSERLLWDVWSRDFLLWSSSGNFPQPKRRMRRALGDVWVGP